MPNYWGRSGAPMVQPTKDELRAIISEQMDALAEAEAHVLTLKVENLGLKKRLAIAEGLIGEKLLDVVVQQLARD
jgi:hypothetical protein